MLTDTSATAMTPNPSNFKGSLSARLLWFRISFVKETMTENEMEQGRDISVLYRIMILRGDHWGKKVGQSIMTEIAMFEGGNLSLRWDIPGNPTLGMKYWI